MMHGPVREKLLHRRDANAVNEIKALRVEKAPRRGPAGCKVALAKLPSGRPWPPMSSRTVRPGSATLAGSPDRLNAASMAPCRIEAAECQHRLGGGQEFDIAVDQQRQLSCATRAAAGSHAAPTTCRSPAPRPTAAGADAAPAATARRSRSRRASLASQGMGVRQPSRPLNVGQNAMPYGSRSASNGTSASARPELFALEHAHRAAQAAQRAPTAAWPCAATAMLRPQRLTTRSTSWFEIVQHGQLCGARCRSVSTVARMCAGELSLLSSSKL